MIVRLAVFSLPSVSESDLFARRGFRILLRTCGLVFVVGLALVLLDALAGVQLPQPFRSALPWLLVISSGVGITLLVGALGTPKREAKAPKAPPSD